MSFVPVYILILGFTIIVDYLAGIGIEKANGVRKKQFLLLSIAANIGVLFVFKYYNFLNENLALLLSLKQNRLPLPVLSILLPLGLSFHTFQAMSYTIEVYRGNQKAERHFGIFSLYVLFFPQLVAGPIERPQNLLPQFKSNHTFDYNAVTSGLRLMAWGLFKKVMIADRLAIMVDTVYANPTNFTGFSVILATVFFAFQIYCDFSGYSDIAIGAARILGFKLMTNFKSPYLAKSISEFWQRWHISLSTWFKDYLYIYLGGNKVSIPRWYLNLFIVFIVSGLWHGANWTFLVWGFIHALYRIVEELISRNSFLKNPISVFSKIPFLTSFICFCLIAFVWVFFRATNLTHAFIIIKQFGNGWKYFWDTVSELKTPIQNYGITLAEVYLGIFLIIGLLIFEKLQTRINVQQYFLQQSILLRWSCYTFYILVVLYWGVFENRQFIYFQF
jgi:D-alanyl-lipoteichoic acid acyltransferase DltB (MBOAT superfamily)